MSVILNIEDIKKAKELLDHVNSFNLEDIIFVDTYGQQIELDPEIIQEWNFIGLNNSDFVMMEIFKDHS